MTALSSSALHCVFIIQTAQLTLVYWPESDVEYKTSDFYLREYNNTDGQNHPLLCLFYLLKYNNSILLLKIQMKKVLGTQNGMKLKWSRKLQ